MRSIVVRVVAGLSAASWLVFPGFGLIDLSVSWNASWPVVLEAGWGLFFAVLAGAAFVRVAVRPHDARPALVQLAVAALALAVSALAGAEWPALPLSGLLLAETGLVTALARGRPDNGIRRPPGRTPWIPLLALAVAGAVPWTSYAVSMWRANRAGMPVDISLGVDHYAVQGALAATMVVLPALAAGWPRGRFFHRAGNGTRGRLPRAGLARGAGLRRGARHRLVGARPRLGAGRVRARGDGRPVTGPPARR